MGLGAICADQATRGNSRPTRTCASGPDQMAGKGGSVEGQEAPPTVDTICSFLLTTYLWCLKAELPRQWYKLTTNYFHYDSFFFTFFIFPGFLRQSCYAAMADLEVAVNQASLKCVILLLCLPSAGATGLSYHT